MEVKKACEAALSNYEVLEFLRQEKLKLTSAQGSDRPLGGQRGSQVATLMLETLSALEATPAVDQDEAKVQTFLNRLDAGGFDLTKSERLMLLNQRPTSELEVHLLIEESEERLGDEKVQEVLAIVKEVLGTGEEEEQGEEEESMDADANGEEANCYELQEEADN